MMKPIIQIAFVLSTLFARVDVAGQNRSNDILSDSAKLTEFVYMNIHYPLMDFINNVEGTAVYKINTDNVGYIGEMQLISSSGSSSLDSEAKRLIYLIPAQQLKNLTSHKISIRFKLADNKIYKVSDVLEDMPEFPGGNEEIAKFISQNLNWPREGADMSISGSIICGFVIEKDGSINIVEVVRPIQRWFDAEAVRVIKRMPEWKAGKKDGKPVRVYFVVPVRFALRSE